MASTVDLDTLTRLAAQAAGKVVLVGDPSQIGVINGPGGRLAALAHAGHGIELGQIHRFTTGWERQATGPGPSRWLVSFAAWRRLDFLIIRETCWVTGVER